MKLIERELGLEIELKENIVSVVIIENVSLRSSIIKEIYSQSEGEKDGKWLLVENEKSYDLSKEAQVILEPFSLELNSKKMKTKLYQDIKTISQDFYFSQSLELHSDICKYLELLLEKLSYPVKYNEEWNVLEIFKAYGIELIEECNSMCEKFYNYIKLVNEICSPKVFVLVNIKQYLTENEISELYKLAMYSKIQLVLIEFNMYGKKSEYENIYIIDKDSCIITY
jgi:CRISPR-associated protein Csn2